MKKIILGSIITASIFLSGAVQAKLMDKNLEAKLIKVCEAIKSDNKIKVYKAIQNSGVNARVISNGLVCNGYDPVTFAKIHNAESTAEYIARKGNGNVQIRLAKL
jgi:hypothetical protein